MRHVFSGGSNKSTSNRIGAACRLLLINSTLLSLVGTYSPISLQLPARAAGNIQGADSKASPERKDGSGTLIAMGSLGQPVGVCPLDHTSVSTKISGYVARVTVKQSFKNPYKTKIEAIYTFPLGESGAVDDMTMKVGNRTIHGTIKKREEAHQIYDDAKAQGHVASLLDQERTNIFTQSVANIEPGATIDITLQYVELLKYDAGQFSFSFPTVVGPRFIPGDAKGKEGTGWAPDTDKVPDASKITPPVTAQGTRAGHDISIDVDIDAGVPISNIKSKLHEVTIATKGNDEATISLKDKETIANKDFVLSWDVAGDSLKSGYLTHKEPGSDSGYFTLMMLPPKRVTVDKVAPKEMIFLIDCSGSQHGAPLQKAKETLSYIVEHMNPQDTFQIIAFSNQQKLLFEKPQPVTGAIKARAAQFIEELQANGGTWMAPAVEKACAIPADDHRLRIVTFMTDGFVGNDLEILGMIHKHRDTSRWFSFGTGNNVNRMLIDGIAKEGGGEADYVLLNSSATEAGKKFYDHISTPVLTDVSIDFGKLEVKEVFPKELSDVWAERPLYFKGRYIKPGAGTVTLKGFAGGKPYSQTLAVKFPETNSSNAVLGSIWARAKVDRLTSEDYAGAQSGNPNKELKDEIIKTALDHHIMTNYTSFVAVEEKRVTKGGVATTVTVPVEMADGVSREHVFGDEGRSSAQSHGYYKARPITISGKMIPYPGSQYGAYSAPAAMGYPMIAAHAYGGGGGSQSAVRGSLMRTSSPPPPPPMAATVHNQAAAGDSQYVLDSASHYGSGRVVNSRLNEKPKTELAALPPPSALPPPPAEAEERDQKKDSDKPASTAKLDAQLLSLIAARSTDKELPALKGLNKTDKTVEVNVELSDLSDATLRKLKAAGFKLISKSEHSVRGTIKIEKLKALAQIEVVKAIKSIS